MKVSFNIGDKKFNLEQYNTFQEKEILLLDSFDINDVDKVFEILNFECDEELTEEEQLAVLYKFREISIGDDTNIKFTCDHCNQVNEKTLSISDVVKQPKLNDDDIKRINRELTDDNINDYVSFDALELDIDEYDELKQRIQDNQVQFDFIKETSCMSCGAKKQFNLKSMKYAIEIMSEDTLMSLYKAYNYLVFFGNYTKQDIDSMYPFERTIYIGLLNKTKEDLAK